MFVTINLCKHPEAAVTNDHSPGSLKQQILIPSQLWRPKSKTKESPGPHLSCLLHSSEAPGSPYLCGHTVI